MISVSLVILTWNRWTSVDRSLSANLVSADYDIKEIIHVDNGSEPGFTERFRRKFQPEVQVAHARNLGVSTGYNRGLALARGSHVVITGCDRVMPSGWLRTWVEYFNAIPETGCIACYTEEHPERTRAPEFYALNGKYIRRAIPVEARMHSKEFLFQTGFWREDFDTYGYEDSEWSDRAERVAKELGLINYVIPSLGYARHLHDDDFPRHAVPGGKLDYRGYKDSLHPNPKNAALFKLCHARGSPYYNPYSRTEPNWLPETLDEVEKA